MSTIRKLPESLVRLIAAGEVIERPASVVKELLENSLDAGATHLTLEIWGAGLARMRLTDNGSGMTPEDARLALERHATSKLREFDDLHRLTTFGFRGEALPSVAAVSRLEVTTRTAGAQEAFRIRVEEGRVLSAGPAGAAPGTTMDVCDLFFNTPARAKFLKRDATERSHILRVVQELSLVHPRVSFDVSFEGQPVLSLRASTLRERLFDLWGDAASRLIAVESAAGPLSIRGLISDAEGHQATRSHQIFFVNDRPVQGKSLQHAVYEALRDQLPVGRHPAFALFLDLDPFLVDVNVHPAKREVRFADERAVHDVLYRVVRERLTPLKAPSPVPRPSGAWERDGVRAAEHALSLFSTASMVADAPAREPLTSVRFLGQFERVYLLFDDQGTLVLMDQHAAAERVIYEKLLADIRQGEPARQVLLAPLLWDVPADRHPLIQTLAPELGRFGFELDFFGGRSWTLKAVPVSLSRLADSRRFLEELVDQVESESSADRTTLEHRIAAKAACRAAIMAGDPITGAEAERLWGDWSHCERAATCPHGRPTTWRITLTELHQRFRRP